MKKNWRSWREEGPKVGNVPRWLGCLKEGRSWGEEGPEVGTHACSTQLLDPLRRCARKSDPPAGKKIPLFQVSTRRGTKNGLALQVCPYRALKWKKGPWWRRAGGFFFGFSGPQHNALGHFPKYFLAPHTTCMFLRERNSWALSIRSHHLVL